MNRRVMLATLASTIGLAGCLRFQQQGGVGTPTDEPGGAASTDPGSATVTPSGSADSTDADPSDVSLSERWTADLDVDEVWTAQSRFLSSGDQGAAAATSSGVSWTSEINGGGNNHGADAFDIDATRAVFGITPDTGSDDVDDDAGASFHAYRWVTGEELWSVAAPSDGKHWIAEGVAILGDTAFVAASDAGDASDQEPLVIAVDAETGDRLWETGVPDLPAAFVSGLFVHGEQLYVTMSGNAAQVLDPNSGSVTDSRDALRTVKEGGTKHGNAFFTATWGEEVVARDLGDDGVRWSSSIDGRVRMRPAVDNELVVVGTTTGAIYAFERRSGERRWDSGIDSRVVAIELSPSLVWVAGESGLTAHTRGDGETIHRSTHDVEDVGMVDDTLLVGGDDATAYTVDVR